MGQHRTNANAQARTRGELPPKPKAAKPLSKREAAFLEQWAKSIMARRPEPHTDDHRCARSIARAKKRGMAARLREANRLALKAITARKKAARKGKAA